MRLFPSALVAFLACPVLFGAQTPKSGFITTSDGVRLHYLEAGSGPAIVFIPGWTMPASIWESQIAYFAAKYRVIAIDPRSQGESGKPLGGHYPERRAQDYKDVVDQLKLAPAALVGWSLAVSELLTYVELFGPSTVRALALVDGPFGSDPAPGKIPQNWAFLMSLQKDREKVTRAFVRGMYKKPQTDAYIEGVAKAALGTPGDSAIVLLGNLFAAQRDWRPALAKVDRPVLYAVQGANQARAEAIRAALPSARVEIFEDAGHALFVDDAGRFNKLLEDFLSSAR